MTRTQRTRLVNACSVLTPQATSTEGIRGRAGLTGLGQLDPKTNSAVADFAMPDQRHCPIDHRGRVVVHIDGVPGVPILVDQDVGGLDILDTWCLRPVEGEVKKVSQGARGRAA